MTDIMIVSVEGNIGSGKSTLLQALREKYAESGDIVFLAEPVEDWIKITDAEGETILEKFYRDQEKYAFPFQMMAYISRLKLIREAVKTRAGQKTVILTERSLFTDKMVFAQMLYDSRKIEEVAFQIYLTWFDTFAEEFPIHKVVYIRADPEVCSYRIGKRLRDGEDNIPLEYLSNCAAYHDRMMDTSCADCVCKDQLVLNGNVDIVETPNQLDAWMQMIEEFIHR